jgi:hypothetical protein
LADNSVFDPGTGGDTYRSKDRAGVKTEITGLDINIGGGSEVLQTAAALADTTANPTTAPWAGMLMCFNGTTWDRLRGDTTNGIFANVKTSVLPTGAATSAKQPALGTAGSASADVLSVQGVASMTALKTDGSGVTQPVSGTVTATGPLTDTQLRASAVPVDTELPAAAALADGAANPTTPTSGSAGLLWNGTTWDRAKGDATNGAFVNVKTSVLPTGASTSAKQPALGTAGAASADVLSVQGVASMTALKVDGSAVTQPVSAAVGSPAFATVTPSTTGGWSKITALAQTTTKKVVKASPGTFGGYYAYNPNASVAYIQVFDAASASVTLGSTAPDLVFAIPPTSAANLEITNGVNMANAMTLACTTTATGSTAPSTGLDLTLLFK